MELELVNKIRNCQRKISENNLVIEAKSKENVRLLKSLSKMLFEEISPEKKERYDKELASDNWKIYSESYKGLGDDKIIFK